MTIALQIFLMFIIAVMFLGMLGEKVKEKAQMYGIAFLITLVSLVLVSIL